MERGFCVLIRCDVVLAAASGGDLAAPADVGDGAVGRGGVAADRAAEGGAGERRWRERAVGQRGQRGHHQDSGESRGPRVVIALRIQLVYQPVPAELILKVTTFIVL